MKLLIIAAVLAAAGYAVFRYWKGRRARAMAGVAAGAMLSLEEYGPEVKLLDGTGLPLFIDGRGGFGRFLLRLPPNDGARAWYFDYHCALGEGAERREKKVTAALFEFETGAFPDFHLAAANEPSGETSGLEPAELAGSEGFPEGARLYCRDQAAVKKHFTGEKAACFGEHPGWSAQGSGRYLVLYRGYALVAPEHYRDFMAEAEKLAFNIS